MTTSPSRPWWQQVSACPSFPVWRWRIPCPGSRSASSPQRPGAAYLRRMAESTATKVRPFDAMVECLQLTARDLP